MSIHGIISMFGRVVVAITRGRVGNGDVSSILIDFTIVLLHYFRLTLEEVFV